MGLRSLHDCIPLAAADRQAVERLMALIVTPDGHEHQLIVRDMTTGNEVTLGVSYPVRR